MFEASLVNDTVRTARPYTASLSLALQVAAAAAAALYPLWHIEALPFVRLKAPSPFSRAIELVDSKPAQGQASAVSTARRLFHPSTVLGRRSAETIYFDIEGPSTEVVGEAGPIAAKGLALGDSTGRDIAAVRPPAGGPAPTPEPKPIPVPGPSVQVGGRVRPPQLIHDFKPAYPALARQTRTQGTVRIEAIISREGIVRDARVVSGHPLLVAAALDAVRQWRYRPTVLNEEAVEVALALEVNFILSR